ncbi:Histamine H2 receptor [Gaertneriomyces sp. JEL0708]|nr:Histamine H2 receptor [Gaertneriomyces sp. JEL0708]
MAEFLPMVTLQFTGKTEVEDDVNGDPTHGLRVRVGMSGEIEVPAHLLNPDEFYPFAPWQVFMASFLGISAIATVITNGFVFVLIYRWKELRTLQNILIMSLAVPDFLVGIVKLIEHFPNAWHKGWSVGDFGCQFVAYADISFCTMSVFGVLLLSLERYLAIVKKRHLTSRELYYILAGIFCGGLLLGSMPYWFGERYVLQSSMLYCCPHWAGYDIGDRIMNWASFVVISIPTFGSAIVYSAIFKVVRANRLQWATKGTEGLTQANRAQQRAEELEARIAKKFAIIVGVFCFNWMFYDFNFLYQGVKHSSISPVYDSFSVTLAYTNSLCNPIICILLDERWRKATKAMFGYTVSDFGYEGAPVSGATTSNSRRATTKVGGDLRSGDQGLSVRSGEVVKSMSA